MENPPKKIKLESENDFENSSESQQENFLTDQKVKKDPEGNFLFLSFESPKMPKPIKREVTKMEINRKRSVKFSKHQCKICQRYFCDKRSVDLHTELHFQPSNFECKKCGRVFKIKGSFDTHKCLKQKTKKTLQHKIKESEKQKNVTCDHCGKKFNDKRNIWHHIKIHAIHKVECKICHVQVKFSSLTNHKSLVHKFGVKTFKCKICNKVLKNSLTLQRHEKLHERKKFECQFCDKKFSLKAQFNHHMKFHENPEQFKCQVCGLQAKEKGVLKKHLSRHQKLL
jgi:hypothetical protein